VGVLLERDTVDHRQNSTGSEIIPLGERMNSPEAGDELQPDQTDAAKAQQGREQ
jgi:hypothetical protein